MSKHALGIILVIATALRLALLAAAWDRPERMFTSDSAGYVELANSLVWTGQFQQDGIAEIIRTPGYPAFLLSGHLWEQGWWRLAGLLQIAFDVLTVYLTYLLGCLLCSRRTGLWAAALQAISAVAIASCARILSDGVFTLLLTMSVLLAAHHFRTGRLWSLAASAAVLAAGCYFRPTGLMIGAILVVVLLVRPGRLLRAPLAAGILLLATAPWVVRNGLVADYWGFSSLGGQVLYDCQAPTVLADVEDISFQQASLWMQDHLGQSPSDTPGQVARKKQRLGLEVLAAHPWRYAALHAKGNLGVWLPAATDVMEIAGVTTGRKGTLQVLRTDGLVAAVRNYFGRDPWAMWLAAPIVLILAGQYLAALAGVAGQVRSRMGAARWLILLSVLAVTLTPGTAGHPRYRTPVEPLVSLTAAAGAVALLDRWRRRRAARQAR